MVARKAKKAAARSCGEDSLKKIEKKAYEIWQKKGSSHGNDWADWFEAEKAVKND